MREEDTFMKKRFTARPVFAASLEELGQSHFYSYDYDYSWFEDALAVPEDVAKVLARWYNEEFDRFKTKEEFVQYLQSSDFLDSLDARDLAVPRYEQTIIKRAIKKIVAVNVSPDASLDEDEILEMAQMHFEQGTYFELEDFDGNEDAYTRYLELVELGPAGFYEEYKDELDFDEDFVREYGQYYDDED